MTGVKWIKMSIDMFDDDKIRLLESMPEGDTMIVIWCKLLTMAGKSNQRGYIMLSEKFPYTEDMLVTIINRPTATVRMALEVFQRFGMLEFDEDANAFALSNWSKHQNIEGMDRQRELTRQRVAKHRKKKKELPAPEPEKHVSNDECNVTSNVSETENNAPRKEKGEERKEKGERESREGETQAAATALTDQDFQSVINHHQKAGWGHPNAFVQEEIIQDIQDHGPDVVCYAIEEACRGGYKRYKSARSWLNEWEQSGLIGMEQIKSYEDAKLMKKNPSRAGERNQGSKRDSISNLRERLQNERGAVNG